MQSKFNWQINYAKAEHATEILELMREGMSFYATQSGLSFEIAETQLSALNETLGTVEGDIAKGSVLVVCSDKQVVASLRLKELPPQLGDAIVLAGEREEASERLSLESSPVASVTSLPSYDPRAYYLLTRFAVAQKFRASGIGAALVRTSFEYAALNDKKGIFLYTAVENSSLLNFYRSFGFQVQSVSSTRGYPRALLFAPC